MKILYGVQATGQGHISRARAMAEALSRYHLEVTWLFSGRAREELFDMQPFGKIKHRQGLTLATSRGRLNYMATVRHNNLRRFFNDVRHLDLAPYDLIFTDYEPVTAWAARRAGRRCIGIGHQYAFQPGTPRAGGNFLTETIMQRFAPVDVPIGLHWHPYTAQILPPILDLPDLNRQDDNFFLVYLPFEDQVAMSSLLREIPDRRFKIYARNLPYMILGNVTLHPADTMSFKRDLARCSGVICNSGFELISECLQWRKPVVTKPLRGQMEQLSNAAALEQLGYARVLRKLSSGALRDRLDLLPDAPRCEFADVSAELARWIAAGCQQSPAHLARTLWSQGAAENTPESLENNPHPRPPSTLPVPGM